MKNILLIVVVFCCTNSDSYAQHIRRTSNLKLDSWKDGMKVTITGRAEHAKPGCDPYVFTERGPVYIAKLEKWNKETMDKQIEISGVIVIVTTQQYNKDGKPNQCIPGRSVWLKRAVWKVVK